MSCCLDLDRSVLLRVFFQVGFMGTPHFGGARDFFSRVNISEHFVRKGPKESRGTLKFRFAPRFPHGWDLTARRLSDPRPPR